MALRSLGDGFTFSGYSADGNPGSALVPGTGNVSFTFDYDNRAKTTVLASRTNTFRCNADGQRVEQVSSQGTRRYVYDGWTIVAETDGAGTIQTTFLPGVGYVAGTTQFYYRDNALGSTVAVTNSTGAVQSLTEYDASCSSTSLHLPCFILPSRASVSQEYGLPHLDLGNTPSAQTNPADCEADPNDLRGIRFVSVQSG